MTDISAKAKRKSGQPNFPPKSKSKLVMVSVPPRQKGVMPRRLGVLLLSVTLRGRRCK